MSTDRVFELTKALGQALKDTAQYEAMRQTERGIFLRPEISQQLERYNLLVDLINAEMERDSPDMNSVAAWSSEQETLGEILQGYQEVYDMMQAKEDFSRLIYQINSMLQYIITGEKPLETCPSSGCGDCSACSVELL